MNLGKLELDLTLPTLDVVSKRRAEIQITRDVGYDGAARALELDLFGGLGSVRDLGMIRVMQ